MSATFVLQQIEQDLFQEWTVRWHQNTKMSIDDPPLTLNIPFILKHLKLSVSNIHVNINLRQKPSQTAVCVVITSEIKAAGPVTVGHKYIKCQTLQ